MTQRSVAAQMTVCSTAARRISPERETKTSRVQSRSRTYILDPHQYCSPLPKPRQLTSGAGLTLHSTEKTF
jgi:hypothetical protein